MTTEEKPPVLKIESVSQFVGLLMAWHAHKVKVLEHMISVPENTEMSIDGGKTVALTGEMLQGFKAGIALSLMELGTLPFVAIEEDAPATH